jgi:hypothetical protein
MKIVSRHTRIDVRLIAASIAAVVCLGTPLSAQGPACVPSLTASSKVYDKPFHAYIIDSAQTDARLHGGRPTVSEMIYTGGFTYVMAHGKWMKSAADVPAMQKALKEAALKVKATCSHLRDESVNGEPAAVWRIHSVSEYDTSDSDLWLSSSSGMLLKSDSHLDVHGSLGKSHIISRYEYTNVRPPAGVQ